MTAFEELKQELVQVLGQDKVTFDVPMSGLTTFEIGGPAQVLVQPTCIKEVQAVVKACSAAGVELRVIGLGSNILVADKGLEGVVMRLAEGFSAVEVHGTTMACQAGASNEQVAAIALENGLSGYEFASGIPGAIGGAAVMNAGAYDGEFKDVAADVTCVTLEGDVVKVSASEADWSYRHSMMMDKGWIVVEATLNLHEGDTQQIKAIMDDLRQRRESKQPLELPSAGSTFKRPVGYFAGKLIQDNGCQGLKVGGAQVSTKHAGFVVNTGGATAADVRGLIAEVQRRVMEGDGVQLEPEVRMWGF